MENQINGNSTGNETTIIYSPKKVGEILEVTESFVKRLLRDGKLKGFKMGKFWRIPKAAMDEFCAACNGNGNGKGLIAEDSRNRIKFHATLRSRDRLPNNIEVMEQNILKIKGELPAQDDHKKIASIAKLKSVVNAREEKKAKLETMADSLGELAAKAYPGIQDLVNQDPDTLEALFANDANGAEDAQLANAGKVAEDQHPLKVMKVGEV